MKRAHLSAATLAAVLALSGCFGGDDDDTTDASTTVPDTVTAPSPTSTSTTTPTTTLPAPVPSAPDLVTEGATVIVANASRVDGAAGRMSERLEAVGFTMAAATNSSEGPLETSKVYYNESVEGAQQVAESVAAALGGTIVAEPLPTPAPLQDPETIADAAVLLALGNDAADQTLEELQGLEPADTEPETTETSDTSDTGTSADSTSPPTSAG